MLRKLWIRSWLLPTAYVVRNGRLCFHRCLSVNTGGGGYLPWLGGTYLDQGVSTLGWGVPTLAMEVPHEESGCSTWYAIVGMRLAFTQEDFLIETVILMCRWMGFLQMFRGTYPPPCFGLLDLFKVVGFIVCVQMDFSESPLRWHLLTCWWSTWQPTPN